MCTTKSFARENWREVKLSHAEVKLSWEFYREVGKAFRMGKVRQQFRYTGTRPMYYYHGETLQLKQPFVFVQSPTSTSTVNVTASLSTLPAVLVLPDLAMISVTSSTPAPAHVTASKNNTAPTSTTGPSITGLNVTSLTPTVSASLPLDQATSTGATILSWLIINAPKNRENELFYVAVTKDQVFLNGGKQSAKVCILFAELEYHDTEPTTYRYDPDSVEDDWTQVKISDIHCVLPESMAVPETNNDGFSRVSSEVQAYVQPLLENKRVAASSNVGDSGAKKYSTTAKERSFKVQSWTQLKKDIIEEALPEDRATLSKTMDNLRPASTADDDEEDDE